MNDRPVSLIITFYPDDIADIKDVVAEGKASGILEHILEQYALALNEGDNNA